MNQFYTEFSAQLLSTSIGEWLAVILAIVYLILLIKENIGCWPAALLSTLLYSFLFFDVNLYMESALNLYYLTMAVYGWFSWKNKPAGSTQKAIISWQPKTHFFLIFATFILVFISTYLLKQYTEQDFAFIDSFTSWFAVLATYMVTQKVLENWLYWIVIDSVSIYLYLSKGFALTAVLFFAYIILVLYGWSAWKKHYEKQPKN